MRLGVSILIDINEEWMTTKGIYPWMRSDFVRPGMLPEDWEIEWKDYYQILGIERSANLEEIHSAFIFYSTNLHPDKVKKSQKERAIKEFLKFEEAYRNLKNPDKRCIYNSAWDNRNQSKAKKIHDT